MNTKTTLILVAVLFTTSAFASGTPTDTRFAFEIRGLAVRIAGANGDLVGRFKDVVLEQLVDYANVEVGTTFDFDDASTERAAPTSFELRGEVTYLSKHRCVLHFELYQAGVLFARFDKVTGRGVSSDAAMRDAARRGIARVMKRIGASKSGNATAR